MTLTPPQSPSTLPQSYPLQAFAIHEVAIAGDDANAVYIVEIGDSPAAPHQAKTDPPQYYWRPFGKSEPAPHFHLDLLRNRFTRTTLEIVNHKLQVISIQAEQPTLERDGQFYPQEAVNQECSHFSTRLRFRILLTVKNTSLTFAEMWGVQFSQRVPSNWRRYETERKLEDGGCIRTVPTELLPQESAEIGLEVFEDIITQSHRSIHKSTIIDRICRIAVNFRPVSQNFVGDGLHWGFGKSKNEDDELLAEFVKQIRNRGYNLYG